MKIEIWSDVVCPFCYIGKRNLETALERFPQRDQVEIIWKSFILDPSIPYIADDSYADYLVKRKGLFPEQVKGMMAGITQTAKQAGLDFDFDKSILVNSFKAHQLIQLAKLVDKGNEAEELLFKAFFTEGKSIADSTVLMKIVVELEIDKEKLSEVLLKHTFSDKIEEDFKEAKALGVSGVPFFNFNDKHTISGAQPVQVFLNLLKESFEEWQSTQGACDSQNQNGQSCSLDNGCV